MLRNNIEAEHRSVVVVWLTWCIVGWWLLWLGVACLAYGELSAKVVLLVLVSLAGFAIGSSRGGRQGFSGQAMTPERQESLRVPIVVLSAIILYQIPIAMNAGLRLMTIDDTFRGDYYEGGGTAFVLYEQFLVPIALYLFARWMCMRQRGSLWAAFVIAFFSMSALMKAGRFPILFGLFFLGLGRAVGILKLKIRYCVALGSVGLAASIWYSFWLLEARGSVLGLLDSSLSTEIWEQVIVKYHIGSFYLLQDLMDLPKLQTESILPYYTCGYFQYLASLLLRRFGIELQGYPLMTLNIELSDLSQIPFFGGFNAFSTNILPLYLDGGFIFSFLVFFLYGIGIRYGARGRAYPMSPIGVMTAFVMIFGLFQPLSTTGVYYVPLMMHASISFWKRRRIRAAG